MENFITELFKLVSRDDRRIRISKRDDVNLNQIRVVIKWKKVRLNHHTFMIFSKSFTYAISPLISSKIILIKKSLVDMPTTRIKRPYDWRFASFFENFSLMISAGTISCHSHFPGAPLPIADWKVRS